MGMAEALVGKRDDESAHSELRNCRILTGHVGWSPERVIRNVALFYNRNQAWIRPILIIGCAAACVGVAALALAILI